LLFFIGGKMIASEWVHISSPMSLVIIAGVLGVTIIASLLAPTKQTGAA
jgi:tellurite resistance protein TerC